MKLIRMEICAAIFLACTGVNTVADLNDSPYRMISARNAFALRAIPQATVIEKPQPPAAPALEIWLTGVTTLLDGSPRAFLEFFDPQTKKTDRPSPFREGDRYNGRIHIVSIDAALGLVRIRRDGSEVTIDFERNGIKEGTSTQPPVQPRSPVANASAQSNLGDRLISNGRPPNVLIGAGSVTTREEMLARISDQRARLQGQNSSAANILPPSPGRTP